MCIDSPPDMLIESNFTTIGVFVNTRSYIRYESVFSDMSDCRNIINKLKNHPRVRLLLLLYHLYNTVS